MARVIDEIDAKVRAFIEAQAVFFVATAPLAADGHVNLSPKGGTGTLVVVDPHTVAYLDLTASGAETIAHLRENGRITVMVCAFEGRPSIVRLHGRGRVVAAVDPEFAAWVERFPAHPGARAVVVVDVTRISDSCGFAVPLMQLVGERDVLDQANARKGEDGLAAYRATKNRVSIDGLPAVDW
ncbi:pyridoxamine 5'-phosphate oxidase family protein [Cellulomonas sp. APG4]|uniref:pyridoxamine 5'-phosphate oxidase family protein n=1 Tax=Cellulomonas sp. APG4 TaxID=1538656 RepID=UPI00137A0ACE|nr:pyridoxamine 5'-phosphate oxidase family protein [Cellulomonas sp. APG4]